MRTHDFAAGSPLACPTHGGQDTTHPTRRTGPKYTVWVMLSSASATDIEGQKRILDLSLQ
jgi:hypothetical protein